AAGGAAPSAEAIQSGLPDPRAATMAAATPQLRTDLAAADLVVVTIGGNDFSPLVQELADGRDEAEAWLETALEAYMDELRTSLELIGELAPEARIVVSDLYSPLPDSRLTLGALGLDDSDYAFLLDTLEQVRTRLGALAGELSGDGPDVAVAYSGEAFVGQESKFTSLVSAYLSDGIADLHPTQPGYAAIGDAFAEAIWGEARAVEPRPEGVGISVVVDGRELITANKPVLKANRTYLAFRDIADAMGATTEWDNQTKTVTITYGERAVALAIGAQTMLVDGQRVAIDTPAFLHAVGKEQKTYVPLAVLADGLGFQVEYRGTLKTAFINK
ncbi:copper amine oxidase, partial [Paenibacillus sp. IB182496]